MKKFLLVLVLLDLALVAFSLERFPAAGLLHAIPVLAMLGLYGLAVWWAWRRLLPSTRRWGLRLGASAGLVLGGEVLLEYALLPADNSTYGLVEYELFLLLLVVSGVMTYRGAASGAGRCGLPVFSKARGIARRRISQKCISYHP